MNIVIQYCQLILCYVQLIVLVICMAESLLLRISVELYDSELKLYTVV